MAKLPDEIDVRGIPEVSALIIEMFTTITIAGHALRSYQYGNGSEDLAKSVADKCDEMLEKAKETMRG